MRPPSDRPHVNPGLARSNYKKELDGNLGDSARAEAGFRAACARQAQRAVLLWVDVRRGTVRGPGRSGRAQSQDEIRARGKGKRATLGQEARYYNLSLQKLQPFEVRFRTRAISGKISTRMTEPTS